MSKDEINDARQSLYAAFLTLLEASWADPGEVSDAGLLMAADDLDDACGVLLEVLRDDRRQGTAADRRTPTP